eukprot:TRINITY_DN10558_c0_g1_i1.p1 TRINITY_DN10558_c0_g1~~TRINITY_DN10558_c0_g1_i1.p1  ORF type:complete len:180 (-),score=11.51 TRINITY_DN10558_c0_g1_i1:278-817(-)
MTGLTTIYADDVAVVVSATTRTELEARATAVVGAVEDWCARWGMQLSREKTLFVSTPKCEPYDFHVYFPSTTKTHSGLEFWQSKLKGRLITGGPSHLVGRRLLAVNRTATTYRDISSLVTSRLVYDFTTAVTVERRDRAKYLGITLDADLTFCSRHCQEVRQAHSHGSSAASLRSLYLA